VTVPTFGRAGKNQMAEPQSDEQEELEVVVTFDEYDSVVEWRHRELAVVYAEPYASWLANDLSVDLHRAVDLVVVRGCDPTTAYQIMRG
jgi:hypothetical protein